MVEIDWDILEDELDSETLDEPDGETLDKNQVWDTLDVAEIELECDLKDHYHSLRASSPIWASEASLARTRE